MTSNETAESTEWVGGLRAVVALLEEAPEAVLEVRVARRRQDGLTRRLERLAREAGVKVTESTRGALDGLLPGFNHQGVVARRSPLGYVALEELLAAAPALLLALDGVTDPGNLGGILRSAWAFGAGGVLVARHRAVGLTAAAVKAAAGAAEHVPVCRVGNTTRALEKLKAAGYWVWGAAGEAEAALSEVDFGPRAVVVLGAEGRGIRPGVRGACDGVFRIPMREEAGSLNVSVAAGVILARWYEGALGAEGSLSGAEEPRNCS